MTVLLNDHNDTVYWPPWPFIDHHCHHCCHHCCHHPVPHSLRPFTALYRLLNELCRNLTEKPRKSMNFVIKTLKIDENPRIGTRTVARVGYPVSTTEGQAVIPYPLPGPPPLPGHPPTVLLAPTPVLTHHPACSPGFFWFQHIDHTRRSLNTGC